MKTRTPSSSAFAQNGWNFGSESSSPATLPPTAAPRSPSFFTPSSSCSDGEVGILQRHRGEGDEALRVRRADLGELLVLDPDRPLRATSRSAVPVRVDAERLDVDALLVHRRMRVGASSSSKGRMVSSFLPTSAIASGHRAVRVHVDHRLHRQPLTTTSRRRAGAVTGATLVCSQSTKARRSVSAARPWSSARPWPSRGRTCAAENINVRHPRGREAMAKRVEGRRRSWWAAGRQGGGPRRPGHGHRARPRGRRSPRGRSLSRCRPGDGGVIRARGAGLGRGRTSRTRSRASAWSPPRWSASAGSTSCTTTSARSLALGDAAGTELTERRSSGASA